MTAQNHADNDPHAEPTLFSAIITPHRSLSARGFLLVMALVGGMSFIGGMFFFLMGAWPVIGFLGLDVLLVYWAFRANYRAAAAFEEVRSRRPSCGCAGSATAARSPNGRSIRCGPGSTARRTRSSDC